VKPHRLRTRSAACAVVLVTSLLSIPSARAQDIGPTLQKIKDTGAITLGYRESSIGFSYLDGTKPVGYSLDICYQILADIKQTLKLPKLEVKYQAVTSANRMPLVSNGTVDLECGTTTNLIERQSQVAFSPDIFRYNVRMVVKASSGIKSLSDLNGRSVATTTGTTSMRLLRQADRGKNLNINELAGKDHSDSFLMVETGKADAFVMDDILLAGLVANSKHPKDFAIVGEPLRTENQSLMFRKDDAPFKALVDRVVVNLMKSGEMEKLYNKWFMSPIPPKGMVINYPLNAETRDAFEHPSSKGI